MSWLYSSWGWILWALPFVIVGVIWSVRRATQRLSLVVVPSLWPKVLNGFDAGVARRKTILSIAALVILVIATLRPQFGTEYASTTNKGQSILVAVDTSQSMDSADLNPSRLEFAKDDLVTLMSQLKGDRVSLMTFSGTAAIQCPFTIDYMAAKLFIDDIRTGDLPIPGTNLAAPIRAAISAYHGIPGRKTLIIYSDGEAFEGKYRAAAIAAKAEGIVIHTVGIGTPKGDVIPLFDENGQPSGFKVNRAKQTIVTHLNEAVLKDIAVITGGHYIRVSSQQAAAPQLAVLLGKAGDSDYRTYLTPQRHDRYAILAVIVLGLLLLDVSLSAVVRPGKPS